MTPTVFSARTFGTCSKSSGPRPLTLSLPFYNVTAVNATVTWPVAGLRALLRVEKSACKKAENETVCAHCKLHHPACSRSCPAYKSAQTELIAARKPPLPTKPPALSFSPALGKPGSATSELVQSKGKKYPFL